MAFIRKLKCSECGNIITWEHPRKNDPTPDDLECVFCAGKPAPKIPFRGSPAVRTGKRDHITQSVDGMYKQMEDGSVARMEAAAQQFGGDPSDYASLKITDMNDNMREGDIAAKTPSTPVTQQMDALSKNPNYKGGVGFTMNPYGGGSSGAPSSTVPLIQNLTEAHARTRQMGGR